MPYQEIQLTADETGHCINHAQVFSADDQWIVYDARNDDTLITSTGSILMVNVNSREIKELYRTQQQTQYGPGVGAATFSPKENKVLFIQGIRNASEKNPYGITRRTGIVIELKNPFQPVFMDARDVDPPFTNGALRGGTHAHSWSGDGKWISFTYNDDVIAQLAKINSGIKDLRTIGIMAPLGKVKIADTASLENNSGEMFTVVVTKVTNNPTKGSDEIDKAFDEGWIGNNGYRRPDGSHQQRAIAFQGNVLDEKGNTKAEVFVVDLPENITKENAGEPLSGTKSTPPNVPAGTVQKRITFTKAGIEGPRHWLRSTGDGSLIAFLAKDEHGEIQIFVVSPNGGKIKQLTFNPFSIQGPFNFSPDDNYVAYIADNSIFKTDLKTLHTERISRRFMDAEKPVSGVSWSHDGKKLAYNRYVQGKADRFLQVFVLKQ